METSISRLYFYWHRCIDRKIKEKQAVACLREVAVLGKTKKQAKKLLFYCNWNVEAAVQLHLEMVQREAEVARCEVAYGKWSFLLELEPRESLKSFSDPMGA